MSGSIPLIRSGAIFPMRRWLIQKDQDERAFLKQAGLDWVPMEDPTLPIPLGGAVALLAAISHSYGPDTPYRIVGDVGAFEIGLIGLEALRGPTVREGFHRLAKSMRLHCTHEIFSVTDEDAALRIVDGWSLNLGDPEAIHWVQQYDTALIDVICGAATGQCSNVSNVSMLPHPNAGLDHLRFWLGDKVSESENKALSVLIEADIADQTMSDTAMQKAEDLLPRDPSVLNLGPFLSDDVKTLLKSMLSRTKLSFDMVAAAAGMSCRTMRRRLAEEDARFQNLVEEVRLERALELLSSPNPQTMKSLSQELGFADQATLSRAMVRWTGKLPSHIRKTLSSHDLR